jgi:pimeloyl-ACP methyl ester carboxylesterase
MSSTFVLVHGAWSGGWIWCRVADRLRAHDHRVFTPTLTGLADRSHLAGPDINLSSHITDFVNLIRWEELSGIVLAGHSYGGMVISGVAEKVAPGIISSIVFLDAFVPDDGKCVADYANVPREAPTGEKPPGAEYLIPPIPAREPRTNARDNPWLEKQRTWQPAATFSERIRLTGARERIPSKTFVLGTAYNGPAFVAAATALRGKPDWRVLELPCGHDLMLAMPDETATILEQAERV